MFREKQNECRKYSLFLIQITSRNNESHTTFRLTIFANKKLFRLTIVVTRSGFKAVVTLRILAFYFRSRNIHFHIISLTDFMTYFLHWQVWLQTLKNVPLHFLAVNKMPHTRYASNISVFMKEKSNHRNNTFAKCQNR